MTKKNEKNESTLKQHKLDKKELKPPFLSHDFNMKTASWFNERLPEVLWAALIIGNLDREEALTFFRYVAKFVKQNPECVDITLTGISQLEQKYKEDIIKHICSFSEETKKLLSILLLFPELPSIEIWEIHLDKPNSKEDRNKLANAIEKTFWHQSQEATDCRWLKILCHVVGGKMKFPPDMKETVIGILEYPNYGDLRRIRPTIRSSEMMLNSDQPEWSEYFWNFCFENTVCIPEEAISKKIQNKNKELFEDAQDTRKHYYDETVEIRNNLINHFFETSTTSAIDSRHEGVFGLLLYTLSLYIEIILYRTSLSITGRLGLRALVEAYITLSYLVQKEKEEPKVWDDYRSYGIGQVKLIYLKLQELESESSSINIEDLEKIANEDKRVEFIPINLGHWDSANLRKMSEEVNLKNIYDKFYNYTSGFMHANRGAIRESVYQKCINPLHRYHRVPTYELPLMPNIINDAREIMNLIFDKLSEAYPNFEHRLTTAPIKENKDG